MNYYEEIKNKLTEDEIYSIAKDYSKERHRVETYFEVGRMLSEAGKHYGENIIGKYASKLQKEVGKKYNSRTLRRYRQFYLIFKDQKWSTVSTVLSWSHITELLPLKNQNEIQYYFNIVYSQRIGVRELRQKIKSKEYERLPEETKRKLKTNNVEPAVTDYIKNPIVIKSNTRDKEKINEKILQRLILEDIENFLKELGEGFTFIGSEYKIKIGDTFNYIDLLLYNIKYRCYVVVELKVVQLKKEHIGQIEIYMNYVDKKLKTIYENNTVGIIVCLKDNKYFIEYCSNENIISREYKLV